MGSSLPIGIVRSPFFSKELTLNNYQFLSQSNNVFDLLKFCEKLLLNGKLDTESAAAMDFHLRHFEESITVEWHVSDVISQLYLAHVDPRVMEAKAKEILNTLAQTHQPEFGISRDTIADTITISAK